MMRSGLMSLLFFAMAASAAEEQKISFENALQQFIKSPEYQATENQLKSIGLDFASRDLVLQPTIEVEDSRARDNRKVTTINSTVLKPRTHTVSAKIVKPFSTGTELEFTPSWERADTPSLNPQARSTVDWQVSLKQSLWKDGFGRATRMRWEREDNEKKKLVAEALLRRADLMVEFETVYWDWARALHQFELQDKNLKRSREILSWVQNRLRRAAAEEIDLLQARALVTRQEMQVAELRQAFTALKTKMERFIPQRTWTPTYQDLSASRALESLLVRWDLDKLPNVMPLSYIVAFNDARASEVKARETRDSIRSDVYLKLAYGKNAIDEEASDAWRNATDADHEYTSVGVVFQTGLNWPMEFKKVESARAASQAAVHRKAAQESHMRVAWTEFKNEILELRERLNRAKELFDLQIKKANAERERYRKGRSTAFQAITFELEATEAEIALWTLYATMKKTEARARTFAR